MSVIDEKEFKPIPGYSRYLLAKDGRIYDTLKEREKSWYITNRGNPKKNIKGGYYGTRLYNDAGVLVTLQRHRALCLTYKERPDKRGNYIVNHIDGVPGNDSLDNLEWVTYSENTQHAYDNGLYPNKVRPVIWRDLDGIDRRYPSVAKLARATGFTEDRVRSRLMRTSGKIYEDGFSFKWDDDSEWTLDGSPCKARLAKRAIVARDIFTGTKYIFRSARQAAHHIGVTGKAILEHLKNGSGIIPIAGYNVQCLDNLNPWPAHSDRHLAIYRAQPYKPDHGIVAKDSSGKELFFETKALAANYFGISEESIARRCKKRLTIGDHSFYYYRLDEHLGPPIQ